MRAVLAPVAIVATAPMAYAQAQPAPIDAYGELPHIEDGALSQDGKLALLTKVDGKRVIVLLDEEMSPLNMIAVGDIKVRNIRWAGEEMILVERTDTQELGWFANRQAEFANTMIVPTDPAKPVRTVFADTRSMTNAIFGNYGLRQVDGKWYGYYGGIPMQRTNSGGNYTFQGGAAALYRVDLATNEEKRITSAPTSGENYDWLLDENGEIAADSVLLTNSLSFEIKNARGKTIHKQAIPEDTYAGLLALSTDGQSVIYSIEPKDEEARWFIVPLSGGQAEEFLPDVPVDRAYVDPMTGRLIGYWVPDESGEGGEPVFLDERLQGKGDEVLTAFASMNGRMRGWTGDFGKLLISTRGNGNSGTWYMIDTVAKSSKVVGKERPAISGAMVGPVSRITYNAQDGTEIEAILTLPPGRQAKDLPLVMLPHGGPRSHDVATFDWWAQAYASRGYAVLQPNFRGSTNLGEEFKLLGNGEWGRKMQTDLSDGISYLADQGIVDPSRTCIVGASYGGYAALAGVTVEQGVYRCAVSVNGVSDLDLMVDQLYRETGSKEGREYWLEQMGPKDELKSISPRQLASRADGPVLLIHGVDDTVVPYKQSDVMLDALEDAGKPVRLVQLDGEDHWLSRESTRKTMLAEAVAFVMEHNPPD